MADDRTGILKVRPKVLFQAIEQKFPDQNASFKVNIPTSEIGGMTLLESSVLASLIKLLDCRQLFEFGTFMGATTLLLAENSAADARVSTIDIPAESGEAEGVDSSRILEDGDSNDDYLRDQFLQQGARCMARAEPHTRAKVKQYLQDSTTLDVQAQNLSNQFDFIFIDGGHDFETVSKDTENAYKMAQDNAVIVWHDFESTIHADVTHFLKQHSHDRRIVHVEHSMLAFELLGRHRELLDIPG